mgnify:CR=1 FL=1
MRWSFRTSVAVPVLPVVTNVPVGSSMPDRALAIAVPGTMTRTTP